MIQYEFEISGRVQGVNFRQFVKNKAKNLNINGWVKNLHNGNVQVMAQGDNPDIETLEDYLKTGPSMARVKNISKYKVESMDNFSGFNIKY